MAREKGNQGQAGLHPERLHSPLSLWNDAGQWFFKYPVGLKETWIPFIKSCPEKIKFILSVQDKNAPLSDQMIFLSGISFKKDEVSS